MGLGALCGYLVRVFRVACFRVGRYLDAQTRRGKCAAQARHSPEAVMSGSLNHVQRRNLGLGCEHVGVRVGRGSWAAEAGHGVHLVQKSRLHLFCLPDESGFVCIP